MRTLTRFLTCLGLTAAFGMAFAEARAGDLQPGDTAPDFTLPGTDGETYSLKDLTEEQVVVIAWFPKAKTGGCTKECKSLRESGEALRAFDVAYFTASCDEPSFNKEFAEELGLDYPILSDPTKDVARAYGVVHPGRDLPERWTFYIGKGSKVLFVDKSGKTEDQGAAIAAKLKELGVEAAD